MMLDPSTAESASSALQGARRVVLDTNVVLDCFVFQDGTARNLMLAIDTRRVKAVVHQCTLDELRRVLDYPQCHLSTADQRRILDRYLAFATPASVPEGFSRDTLLLPPGFPRCRDRDDEAFLALAYHSRVDALVTKDRDLLKLRSKARRFRVRILEPRELALASHDWTHAPKHNWI